jgi:hypothetical protein
MKLKTSATQAIEKASSIEPPFLDLVLLGTEQACEILPHLKHKKECLQSCKHSFSSVFGTDCKFYYSLVKYKNQDVINIEIGIGYLIQEEDRFLLRRVQPIFYKQGNSDFINITYSVDVFRPQSEDEYLVVFSHNPTTLNELLIDPHCVVTSSETSPLNATQINNNSVLGRLDNDIQSISLDQLSDKTRELITSYSKQIVLGCSQLDVKKLKTSSLQLKPSNRPQSKEGTLTYNENTKALEYYDGEQWRTLQWKATTDS